MVKAESLMQLNTAKMLRMLGNAQIEFDDFIEIEVKYGKIIVRKLSPREAWITKYLEKFEKLTHAYEVHGNFVIVKINIGPNLYMGAALCGKNDKFDLKTGIAVATARAFNEKIPDYI